MILVAGTTKYRKDHVCLAVVSHSYMYLAVTGLALKYFTLIAHWASPVVQ